MVDKEFVDIYGDFLGSSTTLEQCEDILQNVWEPKEREKEPAFFTSKWWDYRVLHPVHATYLFADLYKQQVRKYIREYIDKTEARVTASGKVVDWEPIKAGDIFQKPAKEKSWKTKINGLIRVRQNADRIGCPYPLYLKHSLEFYYFGKGSYVLNRSNVPYPAINLLHNDKVTFAVQEAWVEQIKTKVQHGLHSRYLVTNNCMDSVPHKSWLIQQLDMRSVPVFAAVNLVKRQLLTEEDIAKYKKG